MNDLKTIKPEKLIVMTERGSKRISFTARLTGHGYSDVVIIPDDN